MHPHQGGGRSPPMGHQHQHQQQQAARPYTGWQQPERDYETRRAMIAQIVRLLQQRRPDAPQTWLQKLPDMARRLEDKLYRYARNAEEYKDKGSLKQRLQTIAMRMAKHGPGQGQGPPGGGLQQQQQQQQQLPETGPPGQPKKLSSRKSSGGAARGPQAGMKPHVSAGNRPPPPQAARQGGNQRYQQYPQQHVPKPGSGGGGGGGSGGYMRQPSGSLPPGGPPGQPPPQQGYGSYPGSSQGKPQASQQHYNGGGGGSSKQGDSRGSSGRPSTDPRQVLLQQQQRLLLLRHASKCPVQPPNVCPYTSHCKQMKLLWAHIAKCQNNACPFPHCVSSRYVLSHYHRCKKPTCEVCRPVKEAIQKQNQKETHQMNAGGKPPGAGMQQHPSNLQRNPSFGSGPGGHAPMDYGGQGAPLDKMGAPIPGAGGKDQNLMLELQRQRQIAEEAAREHQKKVRQLEQKMLELQRQGSSGTHAAGGAPPPPPPMGDPAAAGGKGRAKAAPKRRSTSQSSANRGTRKDKTQLARQNGAAATAAHAASMAAAANQSGQQHMAGVGAPGMGHHAIPQARGMGPGPPPPRSAGGKGHPGHPGAPPYARTQSKPMPNAMQTATMTSNPAFSGAISAINTFHRDDIKNHIASLVRFSAHIKPADLKTRLSPLLRRQLDQQFAYIFLKPVDPIAMEIPDYHDVIKHPMDFTTIKRRLEGGYYKTMNAFASDVLLVYDNAILYNPETVEGFGVHETAKEYAQIFVEDYNKLIFRLKAEENIKRTNHDACRLCGGGKFIFEPPVYYCNGKCNSKIKRNGFYYTTPDHKMFWCVACYNNLKDSIQMEDGQQVEKSKLEKKKNADVQEEAWVQCNHCNRWFHQICAMFNNRNEESKNSSYFCPMCILRYLDRSQLERIPEQQANRRASRGFRAKDLPKTKFSDFVEVRLAKRILAERKKQAKELGLQLTDIEDPGEITVRVVLHKDTEVFPRTNLERLYKDAPYNYPRSFPHKVKCILMFQCIDGVDVLFFALYTQSYGSDCPDPNQRCMYVAYLDSVFYMEPRFLRTPMYQELLIATLEYEKRRGFTKAFIWACPPLAGDDYILYCHPKDQKTQKAEMLRAWYLNLLEDARKRGIVCSVDNLYDAYIRRVCDPCGIPNFDGDYWPGVTEQFVEELEREKIDPKGLAPRAKRALARSKTAKTGGAKKKAASKSKKARGKMKKKSKAKSKYRRPAGASAGADGKDGEEEEDDEEENPLWPPPAPAKWIEITQQDALTAKIGECIKQMRDDFFVVYMHHICAECACNIDQPDQLFWLPKDYKEGMGALDMQKNKYAPPYALCDTCYRSAYREEKKEDPKVEPPPTIDEIKAKEEEAAKAAQAAKEKAEAKDKDAEAKTDNPAAVSEKAGPDTVKPEETAAAAGTKRKGGAEGDADAAKTEPPTKKLKEEPGVTAPAPADSSASTTVVKVEEGNPVPAAPVGGAADSAAAAAVAAAAAAADSANKAAEGGLAPSTAASVAPTGEEGTVLAAVATPVPAVGAGVAVADADGDADMKTGDDVAPATATEAPKAALGESKENPAASSSSLAADADKAVEVTPMETSDGNAKPGELEVKEGDAPPAARAASPKVEVESENKDKTSAEAKKEEEEAPTPIDDTKPSEVAGDVAQETEAKAQGDDEAKPEESVDTSKGIEKEKPEVAEDATTPAAPEENTEVEESKVQEDAKSDVENQVVENGEGREEDENEKPSKKKTKKDSGSASSSNEDEEEEDGARSRMATRSKKRGSGTDDGDDGDGDDGDDNESPKSSTRRTRGAASRSRRTTRKGSTKIEQEGNDDNDDAASSSKKAEDASAPMGTRRSRRQRARQGADKDDDGHSPMSRQSSVAKDDDEGAVAKPTPSRRRTRQHKRLTGGTEDGADDDSDDKGKKSDVADEEVVEEDEEDHQDATKRSRRRKTGAKKNAKKEDEDVSEDDGDEEMEDADAKPKNGGDGDVREKVGDGPEDEKNEVKEATTKAVVAEEDAAGDNTKAVQVREDACGDAKHPEDKEAEAVEPAKKDGDGDVGMQDSQETAAPAGSDSSEAGRDDVENKDKEDAEVDSSDRGATSKQDVPGAEKPVEEVVEKVGYGDAEEVTKEQVGESKTDKVDEERKEEEAKAAGSEGGSGEDTTMANAEETRADDSSSSAVVAGDIAASGTAAAVEGKEAKSESDAVAQGETGASSSAALATTSSGAGVPPPPPPPPPPPIGARELEDTERLLEPKQRARPQNPWIFRPCKLEEMVLKRAYIEKETKDDDPLMDNQFFDTRQQFLSLCQGNRYQFDQLRRAKHSSMMVLYHLHNPDEPGFVHSCNICNQEIKEDSWYKCTKCDDFDVCNKCQTKKAHPHEMKRIEQKNRSKEDEEKKNHNKNIQLHMELLVHASSCNQRDCNSRNCSKMKALLAHGKSCMVRLSGNCRICRRIWVLLQIHARQCRKPSGRCPVPRCADIKDHLRRAQAAMSDRRIRAQTDRINAERSRPAEGAASSGVGESVASSNVAQSSQTMGNGVSVVQGEGGRKFQSVNAQSLGSLVEVRPQRRGSFTKVKGLLSRQFSLGPTKVKEEDGGGKREEEAKHFSFRKRSLSRRRSSLLDVWNDTVGIDRKTSEAHLLLTHEDTEFDKLNSQILHGLNGVFGDMYELIVNDSGAAKVIGSGMEGEVVVIKRKSGDRKFALKTIHTSDSNDPMFELTHLSKLSHPGIIKILDICQLDIDTFKASFELAEGGDLLEHLRTGGPLHEKETALLTRQMLECVEYLHFHNIVHRDIKLENFVFSDLSHKRIVLIDFGLASRGDRNRVFRHEVGTIHYMAPEVLKHKYSFPCDMWSLGVVIFMMLTGKRAFRGKEDKEIIANLETCSINEKAARWPKLSQDARDLVQSLLQLNPRDRLNPREALCSPFISKHDDPDRIAESQISEEMEIVMQQLLRFSSFPRLKRIALKALAHNLPLHFTEQFVPLFKELVGEDNPGVISFQRVRELLSEEDVGTEDLENLFLSIDSEAQAFIQFNDFVALKLDPEVIPQVMEEVQATFLKLSLWDSDVDLTDCFDGVVTAGKLEQLLGGDKFTSSEVGAMLNDVLQLLPPQKRKDGLNFGNFLELLSMKPNNQ
ncbi:Histone acetyltransferase HAC1 [Durusdinium trenchii]|uniref:histone acetyltransferase n=1 Tax=Durusdinium trenchii TaxID=1381693 RepID=A0ABP0RCR4_9DINO